MGIKVGLSHFPAATGICGDRAGGGGRRFQRTQKPLHLFPGCPGFPLWQIPPLLGGVKLPQEFVPRVTQGKMWFIFFGKSSFCMHQERAKPILPPVWGSLEFGSKISQGPKVSQRYPQENRSRAASSPLPSTGIGYNFGKEKTWDRGCHSAKRRNHAGKNSKIQNPCQEPLGEETT